MRKRGRKTQSRHSGEQTGEIIIGWGSWEIKMKCEIEVWLGWKWDDTNETERQSVVFAVPWQHKECHMCPAVNRWAIYPTEPCSEVILHHLHVPFIYGFTCKQCWAYNLGIICSCCFICLYLIASHMAKQHAIQFTYSIPPFPTSASDKIQTHSRTNSVTLDIGWLFFLS